MAATSSSARRDGYEKKSLEVSSVSPDRARISDPGAGSSSRSTSMARGSVSGGSIKSRKDEVADANNNNTAPVRHHGEGDNNNDIEAEARASAGSPEEVGDPATPALPPPPEASRTKLETAIIITALASALFLAALDVSIITVAIPAIAADFNSTVGYTWIGSAYLLANAAAAPSWGKISDIWGRKQILLLAAAVFWVGSLLCAVSVSMPMLIASRAVQGVGGGGIIILVNVCISDLFSMRRRGVYFGVMGLVWAVAGGLGPVLGGVFTQKVTWRWCFYINLPIAGLGIAVLFFVLKLHNPRTPMRQGLAAVDWVGSLTIVAGTVMVLMGLTLGGVMYPWSSPTVLCLLCVGAAVLVLFVLVERYFAAYPVVPMCLFRERSNVAAFAASFCHGFVFISGSYYLPLYFQSVVAADPLMSGVYVLPFTLTLSFVSVGTGIFIKKTGKYLPPIIFGFVVMTLGFALFIDFPGPSASDPNWAKIILYQIVAGIGTGPNFQSPLLAIQTTVPQSDIASATATFQFIRQLSTSISVVVGGVIFQNGMELQHSSLLASLGPEIAGLLSGEDAAASVAIVADLPGERGIEARAAFWRSLRTMYILYAVMAGLGLIISFFIGSRKLSKEHEEHKTGLKSLVKVPSRASGKSRGKGKAKDKDKDEEKDKRSKRTRGEMEKQNLEEGEGPQNDGLPSCRDEEEKGVMLGGS